MERYLARSSEVHLDRMKGIQKEEGLGGPWGVMTALVKVGLSAPRSGTQSEVH